MQKQDQRNTVFNRELHQASKMLFQRQSNRKNTLKRTEPKGLGGVYHNGCQHRQGISGTGGKVV